MYHKSFNNWETFTFAAIAIFIAWYVRLIWTKRRLYYAASKCAGPVPLPLLGNALLFSGSNSDNFYTIERLIKTYENPVRLWLGSHLIFLIQDLKDVQTICNSEYAISRGDIVRHLEDSFGYGLFTQSHVKWRKTRKIVNPTFNLKILDNFVPIFSERTAVFAEILKNKVGKGVFDMEEPLSRCVLDIFCETAMGIKMNLQIEKHDFVDYAHTALEITIIRIFSLLYQSDLIFKLSPLGKELKHVATHMSQFVDRVIQDKKAAYKRKLEESKNEAAVDEETKRQSFLERLIELSETGSHLTDEELRDEVKTFMAAGTDTSTMFNGFAFLSIGMRPQLQEEIYQEIIDVVGPDRPIEAQDLSKLQLLERVIKEVLRLYPLGPYVSRQTHGEIQLEKVVLPAGCTVILAVFNIHRNPDNYPDPYAFNPDRFLPEEIAKRNPYTFIPFGMGIRNCIGMRYAIMVSKVILATVIRKYKVHAHYVHPKDLKLSLDLTLKSVDGYKVWLENRD